MELILSQIENEDEKNIYWNLIVCIIWIKVNKVLVIQTLE